MCRGEFLLAWYEPGMSKDMKWVKRHRAMLDSWPESGEGPGSGGSGGTTLVGHTVTSRVPWRLTCHWQAGSIQAKPRPLNLAAAVHCFDWTFLLYASLMHSIKLRVGHHWQLWSFILYFVKCIFLTFIICFVFKQKVWSLWFPSFPFGPKYVE